MLNPIHFLLLFSFIELNSIQHIIMNIYFVKTVKQNIKKQENDSRPNWSKI